MRMGLSRDKVPFLLNRSTGVADHLRRKGPLIGRILEKGQNALIDGGNIGGNRGLIEG